jgi:hypothetical protein
MNDTNKQIQAVIRPIEQVIQLLTGPIKAQQSTGTHTFVVAHPASLPLDIYAQFGF